MKVTLFALLYLFVAPFGWGSESLFSFLGHNKVGSNVSAGHEGIDELPELRVLGQDFSAYRDLDRDGSIMSAGLYFRRKTSEVPVAELEKTFAEMTSMISAESGEANLFEVPNFEDATERIHLVRAWKDENSILILQSFESPGRFEIDLRHVELEYFISNLGADFGSFVLTKLKTESGILSIPTSVSPTRESEDNELPVGQEPNMEKNTDLSDREKSGQSELTTESEERGKAKWLLVVGAIAVLGVVFFVVRLMRQEL